jgi:hypothetical protein
MWRGERRIQASRTGAERPAKFMKFIVSATFFVNLRGRARSEAPCDAPGLDGSEALHQRNIT